MNSFEDCCTTTINGFLDDILQAFAIRQLTAPKTEENTIHIAVTLLMITQHIASFATVLDMDQQKSSVSAHDTVHSSLKLSFSSCRLSTHRHSYSFCCRAPFLTRSFNKVQCLGIVMLRLEYPHHSQLLMHD